MFKLFKIFFLNPHLRICLFILEREEGRERERSIDWLPLVCTLTWSWTWNLLFGIWADAPINLATPARAKLFFFFFDEAWEAKASVVLVVILIKVRMVLHARTRKLVSCCHPIFHTVPRRQAPNRPLWGQPYLSERASLQSQEFRTVWVRLEQGGDKMDNWMNLRAHPIPPVQYLPVFM